jgi:hypothetical protein
MSKAAKRKIQRTNAMTTEQLAEKAVKDVKDVKQMSPDEKAKLRTRLRREFGPGDAARKLAGLAVAARRCAAEESAMLNYDGKGKLVN